MAKMDCPGVGEARGGEVAAREARWRRGDDRRRPALDGRKGDGARREIGGNQGKHRQPWGTWSTTEWSEEDTVVGGGLATETDGGAGRSTAAAT